MPYIDVKISKKLTAEDYSLTKAELGSAISLFPGKSESWLMCSISDEVNMWFRGDNSSDSAFIEVKLFGSVDKKSADSFTRRVCEFLSENYGIDASRVYIRYAGGTDWGWNGSNF